MALHFHAVKIKSIKKETVDCVSVTLDLTEKQKEQFAFTQGQNITIKAVINNEELRRSYSICSTPFANELTVAIKKIDGGKFSTYANEILKEGDNVEVLPPTGKFNTTLNIINKKNYTAFAAGSGITPIISILKTTLAVEPNSSFTLVYINKSKNSIIFFEELEALKNKYLNRFNLMNILTREKADAEIFFGRLDANKLTQLDKIINYNIQHEFFICGPEEMIFCVKDFLEAININKSKIHFELFTSQGKKIQQKQLTANNSNESKTKQIQIILDGRIVEFAMPISGESILDEALKQGADLPFACKGGMCCTCKAKLIEGEVDMEVNWGLEEEEVKNGFILTCQAHPITDKVVIDFDVR